MELGKAAESAFIGGLTKEEFIDKARLLYHKVNCTVDLKKLTILSLFRWYLKLELPIER